MKHPGQPKEPPSWYRDRGQSYIEELFTNNLDDLVSAIEAEHWFGDPEKHSRYRVDFLLKDARLIVELDGHDFHSTKDQLEKDAIRQRYLSRAGYTVIRFTGREIVKNVDACISELRTIYKERMQRSPSKYRVMYIDYPFLQREITNALMFYRCQHPEKNLYATSVDKFIPHAIKWLHERSFITAFVFYPPENSRGLESLDGYIKEYDRGEVRVNLVPDQCYARALSEHLLNFSHLFDEFYLIADDPVYVTPFRSALPKELSEVKMGAFTYKHLANGKLLRKGNYETAFAGTDLAYVKWQDIWYAIGSSMGLHLHEL
jgi:hypothetical protein